MLCAICGTTTNDRIAYKNLVVISHESCVQYQKEELCTDSILDCLLYDEQIRQYKAKIGW